MLNASINVKLLTLKAVVMFIVLTMLTTNFIAVEIGAPEGSVMEPETVDEMGPVKNDLKAEEPGTRSSSRGTTLDFTDNSTGFPSTGDYNFITFGDFNNDGDIDVASGAEDYPPANTVGLKAYTGNGGNSWTSASTNLWTGNSWGGVQLVDADEDGAMELYAVDEQWGTDNTSGLQVFEYRSGAWTNAPGHTSTPFPIGVPDNVLLTNITGDSKVDMVLCNNRTTPGGLIYYENKGGNPITWQKRSSGLPTSIEYTALAVADMNKDGLKDIVAMDYSNGEHMFVQQTAGNLWQEYSTGLGRSGTHLGVAVGDVNNDTHMDIIMGGTNNGLKALLGNSGGGTGTSFTWTNANTGLTTSDRYAQIQVVDIDLDNDLDIIAPEANNNAVGIDIYLGNGSDNPGMNLGWTKATNTNLPTSGRWYGANCYDINQSYR
jgi:hypothetical protein